MAIIYSFPEGTPTLSDTVLGTQFDNNGNPTKSFSISDIIALVPSTAGFVPYTGATQSVDLGAFDLTATSIIKAGGTSVQYLMADGSTSTAPSLTGFVPYVGATQNVNLGSFNLTATSIVKAGGTNLQFLMADGSVTTGGSVVTSVTGTSPIISSGGATPAISIPLGTSSVDGYLSAIDRTNFQTAYTNRITSLTTTGTGAATLVANVLNIPTPSLTGYVPYTGATGAVDLGAYNLTVNGISVGIGSGSSTSNIVAGGSNAGNSLSTGTANSFFGNFSGRFTTTGSYNTFIGYTSGYTNVSGGFNTAIGSTTLYFNTTGSYNSAFGLSSNRGNTTGIGNVTFGAFSAYSNTIGNYNTNIGYGSGYYVTTGNNNIYLGYYAGRLINGGGNNTTSANSVFLGANTNALADNQTNQIVIGDSATGAGSNTVTLGNTSITTTRLRGAVQGGSFVKDSGTVYQTLMADGSVTTDGTLYKTTSATYQSVSGTSYFYSTAIPSNIFASGDNLKINTITATSAVAVTAVIMRYYINTTPSIVGATQIANWSGNLGSISYPMDRIYWVNGGDFYARNFTSSSPNSSNTGTTAINNTPIPGGSFYIIVEITTTAPDLAGLLNFQIIKS